MKISTLFQIGKKIEPSVDPKTELGLTTSVSGAKDISTSESILSDFRNTGLKSGEALQGLFNKYGVVPSKETVSQVTAFISKAEGTEAEKLKTVETALYKGIELTQDNLSALHQALIEDEIVAQPAAEVPVIQLSKMTSKEIAKVLSHVKLPEALKAVLKQLLTSGESLEKALIKVAKQLGINLSEKDSPAQMIQKISASIQLNPSVLLGDDVAKIAGMGQIINNDTQTPSLVTGPSEDSISGLIPPKVDSNGVVQNVGTAQLADATQLATATRIANATQLADATQLATATRLADATQLPTAAQLPEVKQAIGEHQASAPINERTETETSSPEVNENQTENQLLELIESMTNQLLEDVGERFASLAEGLSLKTYLVETVTEATLAAKKHFETFKSDLSAVLEQAKQMPNNAATKLSQAIDLLGKTIMRSEVTLYADMKTERSLLVMGAELEKAEVALKQGDFQKAKAVIDKTLELLNKIDFNPSRRKLQVFAMNRLDQVGTQLQKGEAPLKSIDTQIKDYLITQRELPEARLSRDILDTIRFLGLNHEAEVAEALEMEDPETLKEWNRSNVKEILLKTMKDELKERTVTASGETLMNLSGQQMMNDSDSREKPFHFFNLPIMDGEELGNMKVFMKGADKNGRIDWQNTELYFGVKLDKKGPVTLRVSIVGGCVDVKIQSEDDGKVMEAMTAVMDDLETLGFAKGKVVRNTAKETREDAGVPLKTDLSSPIRQPIEGKGFDVKI